MFYFYSRISKDATARLTATSGGSRPHDRTAVAVLPLHPFSPPACLLCPPSPWLPTLFIPPMQIGHRAPLPQRPAFRPTAVFLWPFFCVL